MSAPSPSIRTTDAEAVPIATIPLAVLPRPTGTDDIRRSECFLNPAGCASESTGSPHDEIPTCDLSEYANC